LRQADVVDLQGGLQLLARDALRRARLASLLLVATVSVAQTAAAKPPDGDAAPVAHKLTRPPTLARFVEAPYPEAERAAGRPATVVLELSIDAAGVVQQARVTASAGPAFDAAAVQAARQFVFEPAEVDGRPSPIRILYRYEFVLRAEVPTTAELRGQVRDAHTKKPLPGVRVSIEGAAVVTTDADGRFHVDAVAPGAHAIRLSGDHLPEVDTSETLAAGQRTQVTYDVEPQDPGRPAEDKDDLEIVVAAPTVEKQVVSTQVSADEARKVPGTQGDVLKVVENLPGVARAPVGSGQLVVWGAAPQDTRVYMDGVPLPTLYHQGGFRSVIHSDMVQSVELVPGAWSAEYGRGIGGLVDVHLRPLDGEGVHGSVSADLLDASADVRARLSDRVSVEIAGRQGYLERLLPLFTSRNVGEYVPIPSYRDAQARVVLRAGAAETLELGGLVSGDTVDDDVPSDDPTNVRTQTHATSFERVWLRWRKQTADGAEILVVPSFGVNSDSLVDQFGEVPTSLRVDAKIASVRASWRKPLAPWVTVAVGVDGQLTSSHFDRTGSNTSPPRSGDDYVFGQPPSNQVAHDDGTSVSASAAPYAVADVALDDGRVHLLPGARVEPYLQTASRTAPAIGTTPAVGLFEQALEVEPRLSARWSPVKWLTWKAGWGIYHQPPAPADLSSVFGNPTLAIESAQHLLWGVELGTPDTVSVEATAFETTSKNLAVRSPLPSPLTAQSLVDTGIGRTRGVQVLVRKTLARRLFGWITYTLSRSERASFDGAPYYPYDYDQTHVLSALGSYDLGAGFVVGTRFRYATGYPRTPVTGAFFDVQTGGYQPFFGQLNSIRIPPFVQWDLRVAKTFAIGRSSLETYLDVQNVTNRANPEEIVYSLDYSQRRTITGLPLLPVAGARFAW
jgi:TonB family protein